MSLHFVTGHFHFLPFLHIEYLYQLLVDIIVIIIVFWSPVTGFFTPVLLLLKPKLSPPLMTQVSVCSISVLCVMFPVQLSFVLNLMNVFLYFICILFFCCSSFHLPNSCCFSTQINLNRIEWN